MSEQQPWYNQYANYLTNINLINDTGDISEFEGNVHELFSTLMENLSTFSINPFENKANINIWHNNSVFWMHMEPLDIGQQFLTDFETNVPYMEHLKCLTVKSFSINLQPPAPPQLTTFATNSITNINPNFLENIKHLVIDDLELSDIQLLPFDLLKIEACSDYPEQAMIEIKERCPEIQFNLVLLKPGNLL